MKVICRDSKTFGNVSENCEYDVIEEKGGRIFRNGIDTEIGFSEIEGQWIIREED